MATFYMTHSAELHHYGVLGMKWGIRRYQNPDGTLTADGKARLKKARTEYSKTSSDLKRKIEAFNEYSKIAEKARADKSYKKSNEFKTKKKAIYKQMGIGSIGPISIIHSPLIKLNSAADRNEAAKTKLNKALGKKYKRAQTDKLYSDTCMKLSEKGQFVYLAEIVGYKEAEKIFKDAKNDAQTKAQEAIKRQLMQEQLIQQQMRRHMRQMRHHT